MERYNDNVDFIQKYIKKWDEITDYGENLSLISVEERNAYCVDTLNSEVHSMGFASYLASDYYPGQDILFEALEAVGAKNVIEIVKKVKKRFPFHHIPKSKFVREKMLEELEWPKLDSLDDEFYDYPDDLEELVRIYIEKNITWED